MLVEAKFKDEYHSACSQQQPYALLGLLEGIADCKSQQAYGAAMNEQHYSKLTATMAADRLV